MQEIWEDIVGYEGYYQVSSEGRIKRLSKTTYGNRLGGKIAQINLKERISLGKARKGKKAYHDISLTLNNKNSTLKVHRLVAIAFISNPKKYEQVNHIDGDKSNNRVENLEWVNHRENCTHRSLNMKTSSIFNGVCWDKERNKWLAHATVNGKFKYIGRYNKEQEAALAHIDFIEKNGLINKYI